MLLSLQMTSLTIPYNHIAIPFMLLLVWNLSIIPHVSGQSNYASHANNIGYQGEGLPEEATLDGKVSYILLYITWNLFADWNINQTILFANKNEFKFKLHVLNVIV